MLAALQVFCAFICTTVPLVSYIIQNKTLSIIVESKHMSNVYLWPFYVKSTTPAQLPNYAMLDLIIVWETAEKSVVGWTCCDWWQWSMVPLSRVKLVTRKNNLSPLCLMVNWYWHVQHVNSSPSAYCQSGSRKSDHRQTSGGCFW